MSAARMRVDKLCHGSKIAAMNCWHHDHLNVVIERLLNHVFTVCIEFGSIKMAMRINESQK